MPEYIALDWADHSQKMAIEASSTAKLVRRSGWEKCVSEQGKLANAPFHESVERSFHGIRIIPFPNDGCLAAHHGFAPEWSRSQQEEIERQIFLASAFNETELSDLWEKIHSELSRPSIGRAFLLWDNQLAFVWGSGRALRTIDAGQVSYRLKHLQTESISRNEDGRFRIEVTALSPAFVGEGASPDEARRNFVNAVHSRFQALCRLRPFQMNEADTSDWSVLEHHIDTANYWATTPVKLIETGVIKAVGQDGSRTIAWIDGKRVDRMPLSKLPPEFAAISVGQWFEALVVRSPGSYEIRELYLISSISEPEEMSEGQIQDWMNNLSNANLPIAESTWATL